MTWQGIGEGFDSYRAYLRTLLAERHGFTYTPDYRAARVLDPAAHWLATATIEGETVGVLTYRIDGYGGCLRVDELLCSNALGRALLLRFLAQHAYQVSRIEVTVGPDEYPETWATGLTVRTEAAASFPATPPLMARLLSMDALNGLSCGPGRVEVEVAGDDLLAGRYTLDGTGGTLAVTPTSRNGKDATLTAAALSGLAYGTLDPLEAVARGLADLSAEAATALRTLLPARVPHAFGKG
ncbi:hypothetical protein Asp14428_29320 [Actinoplanes sp. NBRC 14428]|nr:hypothetical protein Asp14428_29320 [Actinoplanes sp. NBRC 14428]